MGLPLRTEIVIFEFPANDRRERENEREKHKIKNRIKRFSKLNFISLCFEMQLRWMKLVLIKANFVENTVLFFIENIGCRQFCLCECVCMIKHVVHNVIVRNDPIDSAVCYTLIINSAKKKEKQPHNVNKRKITILFCLH